MLAAMKSRSKAPKPVRDEVRQLLELVRFLARTLGFSNARLARDADVPLASLVRYFKGEGEPKVEFLLAVVRAMGLEVREFFELAYPDPGGPSPAREKVGRILQRVQPGRLLDAPPPPKPEPEPEPAAFRREDIEDMMEKFRLSVQELLDERAKGEKPSKSNGPRRENGD
jgi:AcrR family transcriptional regulator